MSTAQKKAIKKQRLEDERKITGELHWFMKGILLELYPRRYPIPEESVPFEFDETKLCVPDVFERLQKMIETSQAAAEQKEEQSSPNKKKKKGKSENERTIEILKKSQEMYETEFNTNRGKEKTGKEYCTICDAVSEKKIDPAEGMSLMTDLNSICRDDDKENINKTVDFLEANLPQCSNAEERNKLIQAACECLIELLDYERCISDQPYHWKRYARTVHWRSGDMGNRETQKEHAERYPQCAIEEWAFIKASHDYWLFRHLFAKWIPKTSDEREGLLEHMRAVGNIALAERATQIETLGWKVKPIPLLRDRPVEEIVSKMKIAETPHSANPKLSLSDAPQWSEDFSNELNAISLDTGRLHASIMAIMVAVAGEENFNLPEESLSKEKMLRLAESCDSVVEALEILEASLMKKCQTLLAEKGKDDYSEYIKTILFTIRGSKFIAFTSSVCAKEFAQFLTAAIAPEDEQALLESDEAPEEISHEDEPAEGETNIPLSVLAELDEMTGKEEEPEAQPETSKFSATLEPPFQKMAATVRSKVKLARDAVDLSEKHFSAQSRMQTLPGENSQIRGALEELRKAVGAYKSAREQMGEWEYVGNITHPKLNKAIELGEKKLAFFERYLEDIISQSPKWDVLQKLEKRKGFHVSLIWSDEPLKRGLAICNLQFPEFSWGGYKIRRKRIQLHFHIPGASSLEELASLSPEELAKRIGKAHGKPPFEEWMGREDYERAGITRTEYDLPPLYAAHLFLRGAAGQPREALASLEGAEKTVRQFNF